MIRSSNAVRKIDYDNIIAVVLYFHYSTFIFIYLTSQHLMLEEMEGDIDKRTHT